MERWKLKEQIRQSIFFFLELCSICFLTKWRHDLNMNDKEVERKQYLELSKLYTAPVETSALFMIKCGLLDWKKVKYKKYREKKTIVPCVYFQMLNKVYRTV